jgi:hypothetical protein
MGGAADKTRFWRCHDLRRVAALIRGGLLTEETQNDTRAVKTATAFYEFLDRTLPCVRSSPSTKRFIKNPDSIHQDSNPTNVFTQPAPFETFARVPSLIFTTS